MLCNPNANPQITASPTTTPIRFKPQLPLPGSELFNGQEIIITGNTLGEYIAALYVFVVSAIGILAAVLVFYGGLKWLTAGGDRGRVQDAKEQISSALIGILLVFAAYLLLLTISPKLVRFTSLEIKPVPKRIAAYEKDIAFDARGGGLGTASINDMGNWLDKIGTGIRSQYGSIITPLATDQVPLDLIYAIIFVESGGRPNLRSSAGACGIMQLLPGTAKKTCDELYDPNIGIQAGVAYLKKLANDPCPNTAIRRDESVAKCKPPDVQATSCGNGSFYFVEAAYNGGQGANCGSIDCPGKTWWECTENAGYQETRDYVIKVEAARDAIRPLL
ncbi:MAG: lytic transglycosylase domain-containing protein [Patescibacteria group bacterium]